MNYERIKDLAIEANERLLLPTPAIHFDRFKKLDSCLRGLRPREYTIYCGPTGTGKTAFLSALTVDLLSQDVPVYVASVETGRLDFIIRCMSCLVQENWNLGDPVSPLKIEAFKDAFPWFEDAPLFLARYEDRVSNDQLLQDIRYAVEKNGVKIAILDNLNFFMEVTRSNDQILEMDRVVHDAIIFCKQVDVHLIVVMHPRKTLDGRVTSEFDIKGSSTAVQEAHNVLLWNRPPSDRVEENPEVFKQYRELMIAKCRRFGKYVGASIPFYSPEGVSYEERSYVSDKGYAKDSLQNKYLSKQQARR